MSIFSPDKWLELALDDLESARALYAVKKYRNSYFLFQQSVEKANKAFGLKIGILKEEYLNKDKHDQFKMYRRYAVKQRDRFNKYISDGKASQKNGENAQAFSEMVNVIDSLHNLDLFALQEQELKELLDLFPQMQMSENLREKIIQLDIELDNEIMTLIRKMMEWMGDNIFILIRLIVCAFITIQHSSKTRYPVKDHDPIITYTESFPLIKMQLRFMDALEDAITKLKTFKKFDFSDINWSQNE